jgi:TP901 family phage tail tape measure protein
MARRVLEAHAVISATDATGATFDRVAQKLRALATAAKSAGANAPIAAFADKADAVGRKLTTVGRGITYGLTLPTILAGKSVYDNIRRFELASNKLEAFGDLSKDQVKQARETARILGKDYAFGPAGVLEGMVEQIKAGFEPRHLQAIQKPILDFATLAEIDVPKASELAIFSLAGFGKMYDKTGKMLEGSALNKNLREMVDLFAILNKVAPGDIKGISETFKYSAAAAAQLNVSPEQLGAFTAVLAQAGILGPEAGVALRSMMVRFLKPTRPALASLSALGMKLDDYVIKNPALLKPEAIASAIEQQTGTLSPSARANLVKNIARLDGLSGEEFEKGLISAIQGTGSGSLADADIAGKLATRILGTAIEKIDIMRFLRDAAAKAPNFAAFMAQFMDQRQAVRLANLDNARVTYMLAEMEKELTAARERGTSVSREMAATINSGLIQSENILRGSWQNLLQAMADSGVLASLAKGMDALAAGLNKVAEINPRLIEIGTYAVAATAALGPLTLVLGKFASGVAGLARLFGVSASAAAAGGAAVAAGGAGALAGAAALTVPAGMAYSDTAGFSARLASYLQQMERHGFLPATQTFAPDKMAPLTIDGVRAALQSAPVEAQIKGQADVNVKVTVEPAPDFWTKVKSTVSNAIGNLRVNGTPESGTSGSTGRTMPEAGAAP